MWIHSSLLILGAVALTISISYFLKESHFHAVNFYLMLMGVLTFLWCFGYGMMGMTTDFHLALIFRNIGLFGVIAFLVTETLFALRMSSCMSPRNSKIAAGLVILLGIIDYLLFSNGSALRFIREGDRTSYFADATFARSFHGLCIAAVFVFLCTIGILWFRRCVLKREKKQVEIMFLVNIVILLGSIPDTVMPVLQRPSLPTSAYGAALAYLIIYAMSIRHNAFTLSMRNIGTYTYQYAEYPVLVLNYQGQIVSLNSYTEQFFGVKEADVYRISQLFEMTQEQEKALWDELQHTTQTKSACLVSRNTHRTCALHATTIYDDHGEIYCVICFLNDISQESKRLEELDAMGQRLTNQLNIKSKQLERITLQAISTIANTIDAKDPYTKGHSVRVAKYSAQIAQELGWEQEKVQNLKYIALLHDIGKIGVPDSVLNKPGRLTPVEVELIRSHTVIGGEILRDIVIIEHASDGAQYHHERFDGTGYPSGLRGTQIPLASRIICIADAYDAMNSNRVYREKIAPDQIRQQLIEGRGKQFDPELLDVFLRLFDEGALGEDAETSEEAFIGETAAEAGGALMQKILSQMNESRVMEDEHDYLTQLYSRKAGEKRIKELMLEQNGCILILDMDNLKLINDLHGHLAGDYALKVLGEVLGAHRDTVCFSRLGGDEFLGFAGKRSQEEASCLVSQLVAEYAQRKKETEVLAKTSLSVGMCMTQKGYSYETAFRNADRALYYIKQTGKAGSAFYQSALLGKSGGAALDLHRLVEALLQQGDYQGAFSLKYREFAQVFNYTQNLATRYHYELEFVMITVQDESTEEIDVEQQELIMEYMQEAIKSSLRSVDVTLRFSSIQHLIILLQADASKVHEIVQRIIRNFYKRYSGKNVNVHYETEKICSKDVTPSASSQKEPR